MSGPASSGLKKDKLFAEPYEMAAVSTFIVMSIYTEEAAARPHYMAPWPGPTAITIYKQEVSA